MQLPGTRRGQVGNRRSYPSLRFQSLPLVLVVWVLFALPGRSQSRPWADLAARTLIENGQAGAPIAPWNDETGVELEGLDAAWYNTANGDYFRYARKNVDAELNTVSADTTNGGQTRPPGDPLLASQFLLFYRVTLDARYYKASAEFHEVFARFCGLNVAASTPQNPGDPPGTGLCTAQPFLAEYASVFHQRQDFAGITGSFVKWYEAIRVPDSSHSAAPARVHPSAQLAPLAFALVDALPAYPADDPGRTRLIALFNLVAAEIVQRQDRRTGLFNEVEPPGTDGPQHVPAPSSCLLVYALEKGVRLGYLARRYADSAQSAWQGVLNLAAQVQNDGTIKLVPYLQPSQPDAPIWHDTVIPNAPSRPASLSERGLGQFLLAATEAEHDVTATAARGQIITVDAWYNSQQRKNAAGQMDYFHYKWSDMSDSGYSLLAQMFQSYGMATETLYSAPTLAKLSKSQFYLIVSPDIPVKNPNPHYMTARDAAEIASWVRRGGVLILMENDPPNADIDHLNLLADKFGIHFDNVLHHHIIGEQVEDGRIPVEAGGALFHQAHTLYMKDTCAISLQGPATALLRDRGDVVMASAKYGRGTVFAVVDPWLYNEYTDGRKNPRIYNQFDNFAGGKELVQWLLQQRPH
jgi:unsaturated rhamnogalacturonyl hydrolase